MDLSEFKPPVRLSMSDAEIQAALGSASANEDGMAAAMALLEEQANLREHDNQLLAAWVQQMQNDPRPEAAIALQNLERAKQGLEPLPLVAPAEPVVEELPTVSDDDIAAALNATHTPEPVLEEAVDDAFDHLLEEAAEEATTAVDVQEPVVPANFEVSAEEDATVLEETQAHQPAPKRSLAWLLKSASWLSAGSVLAPIFLAAYLSGTGQGFGTSVIGFVLGALGSYALAYTGFLTSSRTERSESVSTRASFGVFGAIVPGIGALAFKALLFVATLLVVVAAVDGAFVGLPKLSDTVVPGVAKFSDLLVFGILLVVALVVAFAAKALRWISVSTGVLALVGFVAAALFSSASIDFAGLNLSVDFLGALKVAGVTLVVLGIALYNSDARFFTRETSQPKGAVQHSVFALVWVVIPVAAFAHFAALFASGVSFAPSLVTSFAGEFSKPVQTTLLWVLAVVALGLLVQQFDRAVEALKAFALNTQAWWQALALATVIAAALVLNADAAFWQQLLVLALSVFAANVGVAVAESLIRRGDYHDASLLRSYGFYKAFNVVAVVVYLAIAALVAVIDGRFVEVPALDVVRGYEALIAFGAALVLSVATAIPRILEQQREARDIEERRKTLTSVSSFAE
jgi:hypothetical protein